MGAAGKFCSLPGAIDSGFLGIIRIILDPVYASRLYVCMSIAICYDVYAICVCVWFGHRLTDR